MFAGLPQAPSRYSIINHFDRAKIRQAYVLDQMEEEGYISAEKKEEALNAEIIVRKFSNSNCSCWNKKINVFFEIYKIVDFSRAVSVTGNILF